MKSQLGEIHIPEDTLMSLMTCFMDMITPWDSLGMGSMVPLILNISKCTTITCCWPLTSCVRNLQIQEESFYTIRNANPVSVFLPTKWENLSASSH